MFCLDQQSWISKWNNYKIICNSVYTSSFSLTKILVDEHFIFCFLIVKYLWYRVFLAPPAEIVS